MPMLPDTEEKLKNRGEPEKPQNPRYYVPMRKPDNRPSDRPTTYGGVTFPSVPGNPEPQRWSGGWDARDSAENEDDGGGAPEPEPTWNPVFMPQIARERNQQNERANAANAPWWENSYAGEQYQEPEPEAAPVPPTAPDNWQRIAREGPSARTGLYLPSGTPGAALIGAGKSAVGWLGGVANKGMELAGVPYAKIVEPSVASAYVQATQEFYPGQAADRERIRQLNEERKRIVGSQTLTSIFTPNPRVAEISQEIDRLNQEMSEKYAAYKSSTGKSDINDMRGTDFLKQSLLGQRDEATLEKYREEASPALQLTLAAILDPLNLVDFAVTPIADAVKLARATRKFERTTKTVDVVASELRRQGEINRGWGRLNPFRQTASSQATHLVGQSVDITNTIVRNAENPLDELAAWVADPDTYATARNLPMAASEPAKQTVALYRAVFDNGAGALDPQKIGRVIANAAGDDIAAVADLARQLQSGAEKLIPQLQPGALTRARNVVNNWLSIGFMGYNPGYAMRNAANNLLTALVDGVMPFENTDSIRDFWVRWGPMPVAGKAGLGAAGGGWQSRADVMNYITGLQDMTSIVDVPGRAAEAAAHIVGKNADEVSDLLSGVNLSSPTLALGQNIERWFSERIVYKATRNAFDQLMRPAVRAWEAELRANLPPDAANYVINRLYTAVSPQEVRGILDDVLGPGAIPPAAAATPGPVPKPGKGPKKPSPMKPGTTSPTAPAAAAATPGPAPVPPTATVSTTPTATVSTTPTATVSTTPTATVSTTPTAALTPSPASGEAGILDEVAQAAETGVNLSRTLPTHVQDALTRAGGEGLRDAVENAYRMGGTDALKAADAIVQQSEATAVSLLKLQDLGGNLPDTYADYLKACDDIIEAHEAGRAAAQEAYRAATENMEWADRTPLLKQKRAEFLKDMRRTYDQWDALDEAALRKYGFSDRAIADAKAWRKYTHETWKKDYEMWDQAYAASQKAKKAKGNYWSVWDQTNNDIDRLWDNWREDKAAYEARMERYAREAGAPAGAIQPATAPAETAIRAPAIDDPVGDQMLLDLANDARIATATNKGKNLDRWLTNFANKHLDLTGEDRITSWKKLAPDQKKALAAELRTRATESKKRIVKEKYWLGEGEGPDMSRSLQAVFPNADIAITGLDMYTVELPNGKKFAVHGVDNIALNPDQVYSNAELATYGIAPGQTFGVGGDWTQFDVPVVDRAGVMRIAYGTLDEVGMPVEQTIRHESLHVAADIGAITDNEWDDLVRRYGDEEGVAMAYETWQKAPEPHTIFEKIQDFFRDLYMRIFKPLERNTDRTFGNIASGKVWEKVTSGAHKGMDLPPEGSPWRKMVDQQLVKVEATSSGKAGFSGAVKETQDTTFDVSDYLSREDGSIIPLRVGAIEYDPKVLASMADGPTRVKIASPKDAVQYVYTTERYKDYQDLYYKAFTSDGGRLVGWNTISERKADAKLADVRVVGLTTGCQRSSVTAERVANGLLPNETRLEACYGGSCWATYSQRMGASTSIDTKQLRIADWRSFDKMLTPEVVADINKPARFGSVEWDPFIRMGQRGDESHTFAFNPSVAENLQKGMSIDEAIAAADPGDSLALRWLQAAREKGVKAKTVFITASYAPVSEAQYKALAAYKDMMEIHFTVAGWFHPNEILMRLGEFQRAKEAGLPVYLRLVTNVDEIAGLKMVNEPLIDEWIEKLRISPFEVLETPYHYDGNAKDVTSALVPGQVTRMTSKGWESENTVIKRSRPSGKYGAVCCGTDRCATCSVKCMTSLPKELRSRFQQVTPEMQRAAREGGYELLGPTDTRFDPGSMQEYERLTEWRGGPGFVDKYVPGTDAAGRPLPGSDLEQEYHARGMWRPEDDIPLQRQQAKAAKSKPKPKQRLVGQPLSVESQIVLKEGATDLPAERFDVARTSIKQVPELHKKIPWKSGTRNLDLGGGKYDLATQQLREQGVENLVYDPFARPAEHNDRVMTMLQQQPADTATVANVLNVIQDPARRRAVIEQAGKYTKPNGKLYFSVYEGNRSGAGAATVNNTWQENRALRTYLAEIREVYPDAHIVGGKMIVATNSRTAQPVRRLTGNQSINTPLNPAAAQQHGLRGVRQALRELMDGPQTPLAKPQALTPDQAQWLRNYVNQTISPGMIQNKAIAGEVGTRARNFALGDYTARANIHEWAQFLFPYGYWYSFTYPNWAMRIAQRPAILSNYARLTQELRDINVQRYREEMGDPNAEMPEYYAGQVRVPFFGSPYYLDLERTLNPLYAMTEDFSTKQRAQAPFSPFDQQIEQATGLKPSGDWVQALGNQGPTVWSPLIWGYSAWLKSQGYDEAAAQWAGYLMPFDRPIKAATAMMRENVPGMDRVIPAGGTNPSMLLAAATGGAFPSAQGGDYWDRRQVGRYLWQLVEEGKITEEEFDKAAYEQTGPIWERGLQMQAIAKAVPNLTSFALGAGFKPRTATDVEIDKAWQEWGKIMDARPTMDKAQWRRLVDQYEYEHPYMVGYKLSRVYDPVDRLRDYSYAVLDRLPPGRERYDALEAAGLDMLYDKFWDSADDPNDPRKNWQAGWTPEEIKAWTDGISKLASQYDIPGYDQYAETQQAIDLHKRRQQEAMGIVQSQGYWILPNWLLAEQAQYFDEIEGTPEAQAWLKAHPYIPAYWEALKSVDQQGLPARDLQGPISPAQLRTSEDKYYTDPAKIEARKLFGDDIESVVAQRYAQPEGEAREKWDREHPDELLRIRKYEEWKRGKKTEAAKNQPVNGMTVGQVGDALSTSGALPAAGTTGQPAGQMSSVEYAQKRAEASKRWGPKVLEVADNWKNMTDAQKAQYKKQYPGEYAKLKEYWNFMNPEDQKTTKAAGSPSATEYAAKRAEAEKRWGSQIIEIADGWKNLSDDQKAWFKKTYPKEYAKLKQYWDFMYEDSSTGYAPRSYSYGGGGGGWSGRSYGGGGGYTQPTTGGGPAFPMPPPQLNETTVTPDQYNQMVTTARQADPTFDNMTKAVFNSDVSSLASQYFAMSPEQRVAWKAANPQLWALLMRYLAWLQQRAARQQTTTTTAVPVPPTAA